MASTTWRSVTNFQPKRWLLTDGSTVTEPAIEESGSGRMIRFPGTNLKGYRSEHHQMVLAAVNEVAQSRGAEAWMRVDEIADKQKSRVGFEPKDVKATLHVSTPGVDKTILWWVFRHPTLPIEATVVIRAQGTGVDTQVVVPNTDPGHGIQFLIERNGGFTEQVSYSSESSILREFVRDNPVEWAEVLGAHGFTNEHDMLSRLLGLVRHMEDYDTIQIPDLRDGQAPAWLDLDLYETNVNGNFIADLTDVLENGPNFEEAARMYRDLQTYLRKLGLVMEDKAPDSFQRALMGDDKEFRVQMQAADVGGMDSQHNLFLHLPTGTFVVECDLRVDHDKVAAQWDEARTIASITGEEPALLAFARETARRGEAERTNAIAERRGVR